MDTLTDVLIEFIASENNPLGIVIIALSALIEYVVPPFPGDTITLLAAVLITAYDWSFPMVFGAVMAGSIAGSMAAFYVGGWLERRRMRRAGATPDAALPEREVSERAMIGGLVNRFRRHGAVYLVINRFLPGVRALFFVAAGMAGMRARAVLLYSALSALLWNLCLIALGSMLGANFDTLLAWMKKYTAAMWLIIGSAIMVWMVRLIRGRRATRQSSGERQGPRPGREASDSAAQDEYQDRY